MIPLSRPSLEPNDYDAVREVLASGMLVQGANVARFESGVASRVGRKHAIAVSNGTAALVLSLEALGLGAGDEVLVPALTWPSPAHAIRLVGATPIPVDVDPDEWNVRGDALRAARTSRTRAAIAIDQFGNPVHDDEIRAATEGLFLIEDAACAIGSRFASGAAAGSLGVASCLSFHPRKVLTTGEGGMILTDDDALADKLRRLRNHGQSSPGVFPEPGGNHRLTELAAVLGIGQLARLDAIVAARAEIADHYRSAMRRVSFQRRPKGAFGNEQTFGVTLPEGATAADRDRVVAAIRADGVEAGALSYALSRLPSVANDTPCPVSESLVDRGFSLPLYPGLSQADQDRVVEVVERHV